MNAPAAQQELSCNLPHAREFLRLLDSSATGFTFQTFDDVVLPDGKKRGDKTLVGILHGTLEEHAAELMRRNKLGAGVFVAVNATDGHGRKKISITKVRDVWRDADSPDARKVSPLLAPILEVETSPGKFQEHWFVDQLMLPEHAAIMRTMVEKFGSDPQAALLNQVLRLPGFYHCKNPERPHLVRITGGTAWPLGVGAPEQYTRAQLLQAIPPATPEPPAPKEQRPPDANFARAKWWQLLGYIPASAYKEHWLTVGMALHYESAGSEDGLELWIDWSKNDPEKFDEDAARTKWKTFGLHGGATVAGGTIVHLAKTNGWKGDISTKTREFEETGPTPAGEQPGATPPEPGPPGAEDELLVTNAEDVPPTNVEWLWVHRIARGKPNILAGDQGLGKTTLLLDTMARITRGGDWPGGEGRAPKGTVIYLGVEDALDDTIVPRLIAAGADLTRVKFITAAKRADGKGKRSFSLKHDLNHLESLIKKIGDVLLVVIDPLNSYFADADTYRTSEVRAILEPMAEMAARLRVTFWGNSHLSKDGKGRSANLRILDSQAITAVARGISLVAPDPSDPDRQLFMRSKGSNSPKGLPALAYVIKEKKDVAKDPKGEPINATYLEWAAATVALSADEVFGQLEQKGRATPAQDGAKAFVSEILANGPQPATEVQDAARARCISSATLRRAQEELGVIHKKVGIGKEAYWTWELPPARAPSMV
jgi:putative DNA primase/helicase